jgi:hypothetical protein
MTEREWQGCDDPEMMLEFLEGKASDRKVRLFACACWRHLFEQLAVSPWGRKAVDVAGLFADGKVGLDELQEAEAAATSTGASAAASAKGGAHAAYLSADLAKYAVRDHASVIVPAEEDHPAFAAGGEVEVAKERWAQANLLRDIFGNPLRLLPQVNPAWLAWEGGTVPKLAAAVYDERAFDRLPVLADALEEAGCDAVELLDHLRGPGPHVRGCWAVDLLLGKS